MAAARSDRVVVVPVTRLDNVDTILVGRSDGKIRFRLRRGFAGIAFGIKDILIIAQYSDCFLCLKSNWEMV